MKKLISIISGILIIFLIGIVSADTGGTETEFTLAGAQHACVFSDEGYTSFWQWWDEILFKEEIGEPIPPKYSCYSPGGWPSEGCCPGIEQCDILDWNPEPTCSRIAPVLCSDYNDYGDNKEQNRAYCEAFNINTAIKSIEERTGIGEICSGFYSIPVEIVGKTNCNQFTSNCRCYWDEEADGGLGKCKSKSSSYVFCEGILDSEGNCSYVTTQKIDNCDETGLLTYVWGAIWDGEEETRPAGCEAGTRVIDCSVMNLKVFTFWNVIIVILIIIFIYYFISKRKRGEKIREKKKGGNGNEKKK